ncbi:hypothetical protein DL771_003966 [Monosporascus sp. 5C6A]|nr:hypothetical protein DL771_003966 [Monosporascus sp. 5C6A]
MQARRQTQAQEPGISLHIRSQVRPVNNGRTEFHTQPVPHLRLATSISSREPLGDSRRMSDQILLCKSRTCHDQKFTMALGSRERPANTSPESPVKPTSQGTEPDGSPMIVRKFKTLVKRDLWRKDDLNHCVDWKDDRVWEKIRREGCYHRSDEVMISCGTVAINEAESSAPKVLVVYNRDIGIFQLPKGRKDFREGYLDAALRETAEETGVAVRPLRLRFSSRASLSKRQRANSVEESLNNECVGVSEYPDPGTGAWRNIHWYAAQPVGNIERDVNRMTEESDRRKFMTFWLSEAEAVAKLKLDDERFMVQVVFAYISDMTDKDWESNRQRDSQEASRR